MEINTKVTSLRSKVNPWVKNRDFEKDLINCFRQDFSKLLENYNKLSEKSYKAFCELSKYYGITLLYHWCTPSTLKKGCQTEEYSSKVKYLILHVAKSFLFENDNESIKNEESTSKSTNFQEDDLLKIRNNTEEDTFQKKIGAFYLLYILYENQPSIYNERICIDVDTNEIKTLEEFFGEIKNRSIHDENKESYEGLLYMYSRMKIEDAFRPTVIPMELGISLRNLKN